MMYPNNGGRSKTPKYKSRGSKGDDSELVALDQLLGDLDKEIDKRAIKEKRNKLDFGSVESKKTKKTKKKRSKTPLKNKKVFGRDRKLRDHTKLKIFNEIERKLFDTRIDNVKLGQFLRVKQKDKSDLFKYEWARDTNVMNLRFFSYLLMEEIETIIDNMDETRGMNYLNSVDAKMQKRNNIINHLLREKAVTAKLMTKVLAIMENTATDASDLNHMLSTIEMPKSAPRTRILSKLKNVQEDMSAIQQIRSFSKGYFSEIDFQNLIAAQRNLKDPLSQDNFNQLREIRTVFERVNRHAQIADEYKKLQDDMIKREQNYNELVGRYEQLIGDFMRFIGDKNLKSVGLDESNTGFGGFSKEELDRIRSKYDKMRLDDEEKFNAQFQSKGYTPKDFDNAGLNYNPDVKTVKKIKRKKRSRSPKKKSKSPNRRLRSKSPHMHNFDTAKKSRSRKRIKKSPYKKRRKRKISPKRIGFDFSEEYDNEAFRNDSPPMDVELSRISRSQVGGRGLPEFGYVQPRSSGVKDSMRYSENSPSPAGFKNYREPTEVKLFSPHSPQQPPPMMGIIEQPQNSNLSGGISNKSQRNSSGKSQGHLTNPESNKPSSRNSHILASKAPSIAPPAPNLNLGNKPLDAAQPPNVPLPPPNMPTLSKPKKVTPPPPPPPTIPPVNVGKIETPKIAPPPPPPNISKMPPSIPPPPGGNVPLPPPPPTKNNVSQPPKPPKQPSMNQSLAVADEKSEKGKAKDSFAFSGKADTKKDEGFSDYFGGANDKSKDLSFKSSKKDDTIGGYLGNDSFGLDKSKKGGDTLDYLGGINSKSKDSFLNVSQKSSVKGSINAYANDSSDFLQGQNSLIQS